MKLVKDYFKNDTLLINKDGMLYYEDVLYMLSTGNWRDEIHRRLTEWKEPGIYIYKTNIPDIIIAYVTHDEIVPVTYSIQEFNDYSVFTQSQYDYLLSKMVLPTCEDIICQVIIPKDFDEKFKKLVSIVNEMILKGEQQ